MSLFGSQSFATLTVGNSASLLSEILDIGETIVQPIGQTPGLVLAPITIQPMPSAVTSPGFGQNSLGFGRDEQPLVNVLLGFTWLHAADDAKFESAARTFVQKSQDAARKRGLLHPFVYLNYAAPWQDPIASYGAAEKKRLQQVSQKYDPARIFQKAVPGGFKLFGGNE
jgi:hypothetical protein